MVLSDAYLSQTCKYMLYKGLIYVNVWQKHYIIVK